MIGARGRAPITHEQVHIHEPAVDLVLPRFHIVDHAIAKRNRGQSRRA